MAASSYVPDSVKCLEGVDYNVVKNNLHFEWIVGFEKTIKELALEVFETVGVKDENALNIAVKYLETFQENVKTKIAELAEQVANKANINEEAKSFAAEWVQASNFQIDKKYHLIGGPNAQKLRWAFENSIQYIVICATHLADKNDDVDFKKEVSERVKNVVQTNIDSLSALKNELQELEKSS